MCVKNGRYHFSGCEMVINRYYTQSLGVSTQQTGKYTQTSLDTFIGSIEKMNRETQTINWLNIGAAINFTSFGWQFRILRERETEKRFD